MATDNPRDIVLVHGSWHGGWCWEAVIDLLDERGLRATAVELPSIGEDAAGLGLEDDVAAVRDAIDASEGHVVLCGHSYGGVPVGEACNHPMVDHVVFLTAFMLTEGEQLLDHAYGDPPPPLVNHFQFDFDRGLGEVAPEGRVEAFYHDCDPAAAEEAAARLRPMSVLSARTPVTVVGWSNKPTTYVLTTLDQAISPAEQAIMSKRADHVVEWDTGHSPMLSRPDLVADLLEDRARA